MEKIEKFLNKQIANYEKMRHVISNQIINDQKSVEDGAWDEFHYNMGFLDALRLVLLKLEEINGKA